MKTKKTLLSIGASLLIIVLGIFTMKYLLTSAPQAEKQKPTMRGLLVETTQLQIRPYDVVLSTIGAVEAASKTTLSAKVSGKIIHTHPAFIPGGRVKKGDLLAHVDPSDYKIALAQIEAQLLSAKASEHIELGQQASAKKELELSGLNPTGLNRSLILREPQLAQVKATIANVEASLENAKNNLKETAIIAPYDGVITKKSAELGSFITSQSSVAEMVSSKNFWLYASIPSRYLAVLNSLEEHELSSLHVKLSNQSQDLHVKARIIKLLPELDTTTKQARVLIEIEDPLGISKKSGEPHQMLLLGETLHVHIYAKHIENAHLLPIHALRANNTVWVITPENKLAIKSVEIDAKDEHFVVIQKGLSLQDSIITTYMTTAVDGMDVIDINHAKKSQKGE